MTDSNGGKFQVYDRDTSGADRAVIKEQEKWVTCLARLEDDLVVPVDIDGQMFTWCPSTTE